MSVPKTQNIVNFAKPSYRFYDGKDDRYLVKIIFGKNNKGNVNAHVEAISDSLVLGKDFSLSSDGVSSAGGYSNVYITLAEGLVLEKEHSITLRFDNIFSGKTTTVPETVITLLPKKKEVSIKPAPSISYDPPASALDDLLATNLGQVFTDAVTFADPVTGWLVEEAYALSDENTFSDPDPICYILHENPWWVAFIKLLSSMGVVVGILGLIFHRADFINIIEHPLSRLPHVVYGTGFIAALFFLGNCYAYWELYMVFVYLILSILWFMVFHRVHKK